MIVGVARLKAECDCQGCSREGRRRSRCGSDSSDRSCGTRSDSLDPSSAGPPLTLDVQVSRLHAGRGARNVAEARHRLSRRLDFGKRVCNRAATTTRPFGRGGSAVLVVQEDPRRTRPVGASGHRSCDEDSSQLGAA